MGLPDFLGWQWNSKTGIPIVCVPGCPVQPDNYMETLLYLLRQAATRRANREKHQYWPLIPLELKPPAPLTGVPWANWLLIAANVAMYLLLVTFGWYWTCGRGTSLASALLYGFSHAGFWHLAGNPGV
jgi:hypothetical protein